MGAHGHIIATYGVRPHIFTENGYMLEGYVLEVRCVGIQKLLQLNPMVMQFNKGRELTHFLAFLQSRA